MKPMYLPLSTISYNNETLINNQVAYSMFPFILISLYMCTKFIYVLTES